MFKSNTVIILGNGFDLAHGFPTKYSDFSKHLLEVICENLLRGNKDNLISDSFLEFKKFVFTHDRGNNNNVNHKKLFELTSKLQENDKEGVLKFLNSNLDIMSSIISNKFLSNLFANTYTNWFDIEGAFFDELIKVKSDLVNYIKGVNASPSKRTSGELKRFVDIKKAELTTLNSELKEIKIALKKYLSTIELVANSEINDFFVRVLQGKQPRVIHVLNFNYTNTINLYSEIFTKRGHSFEIINIHGNLNEEIIFGYGNDNNNDFQTMLDLEVDEFLENLKPYEYLNKDIYSNFFKNTLSRMRQYDVIAIGHSLQQTDKTLLSGVFNRKECMSITLLKRGDLPEIDKHNTFRKLIFAISRILNTENDELRLKVIDYENLESFP